MKLLIQRVQNAQIRIEDQLHSSIGRGLLVFLGFHKNDAVSQIGECVKKLVHLRIFSDEQNKMNLSVKDVSGEILLVSQFTLYANCKNGRRPDYMDAAPPLTAIPLYEEFIVKLKQEAVPVKTGKFGANMQVSLINDGPVTIIIDTLSI
ncbi:MAG: D-tyrosyl-tRNA(Tyr) deacylase [Candidatus Protochlamydia sp.]|nr:D-tyrosyl-tRNA(Tyr) deacylase [Candidatus Protochlamydia sp.]